MDQYYWKNYCPVRYSAFCCAEPIQTRKQYQCYNKLSKSSYANVHVSRQCCRAAERRSRGLPRDQRSLWLTYLNLCELSIWTSIHHPPFSAVAYIHSAYQSRSKIDWWAVVSSRNVRSCVMGVDHLHAVLSIPSPSSNLINSSPRQFANLRQVFHAQEHSQELYAPKPS
jgi:hypothetical protein